MVSLLPEESVARLRAVLGENLGGLNGREVQASVTADMEGNVSNLRLQQFCTDHTADIARLLQNLVAKVFPGKGRLRQMGIVPARGTVGEVRTWRRDFGL
jgi:hypothetical protein